MLKLQEPGGPGVPNIWFLSDPHYNHKNICRGVSEWDDTRFKRNFDTLDEMNKAIVDGINSNVNVEDILFCNGDWSFGGINSIWDFRKQIKCPNIHFILGNHDHHIAKPTVLPNCTFSDKIITGHTYIHADGETIFDCPNPKIYGDSRDQLFDVYSTDLFLSVSSKGEILVGNQLITLDHYAGRVWNKSHKGAWMLYGHSHGVMEDTEWGKSMDIGIDAVFNRFGEYRPISFQEVKQILDARSVKIIDHHELTSI